jgi:hypothetical protein
VSGAKARQFARDVIELSLYLSKSLLHVGAQVFNLIFKSIEPRGEFRFELVESGGEYRAQRVDSLQDSLDGWFGCGVVAHGAIMGGGRIYFNRIVAAPQDQKCGLLLRRVVIV